MWLRILLLVAVSCALDDLDYYDDLTLEDVYQHAEAICPCVSLRLCPHFYGSSPFDIQIYGNLPPCITFGRARCCTRTAIEGVETDIREEVVHQHAFLKTPPVHSLKGDSSQIESFESSTHGFPNFEVFNNQPLIVRPENGNLYNLYSDDSIIPPINYEDEDNLFDIRSSGFNDQGRLLYENIASHPSRYESSIYKTHTREAPNDKGLPHVGVSSNIKTSTQEKNASLSLENSPRDTLNSEILLFKDSDSSIKNVPNDETLLYRNAAVDTQRLLENYTVNNSNLESTIPYQNIAYESLNHDDLSLETVNNDTLNYGNQTSDFSISAEDRVYTSPNDVIVESLHQQSAESSINVSIVSPNNIISENTEKSDFENPQDEMIGDRNLQFEVPSSPISSLEASVVDIATEGPDGTQKDEIDTLHSIPSNPSRKLENSSESTFANHFDQDLLPSPSTSIKVRLPAPDVPLSEVLLFRNRRKFARTIDTADEVIASRKEELLGIRIPDLKIPVAGQLDSGKLQRFGEEYLGSRYGNVSRGNIGHLTGSNILGHFDIHDNSNRSRNHNISSSNSSSRLESTQGINRYGNRLSKSFMNLFPSLNFESAHNKQRSSFESAHNKQRSIGFGVNSGILNESRSNVATLRHSDLNLSSRIPHPFPILSTRQPSNNTFEFSKIFDRSKSPHSIPNLSEVSKIFTDSDSHPNQKFDSLFEKDTGSRIVSILSSEKSPLNIAGINNNANASSHLLFRLLRNQRQTIMENEDRLNGFRDRHPFRLTINDGDNYNNSTRMRNTKSIVSTPFKGSDSALKTDGNTSLTFDKNASKKMFLGNMQSVDIVNNTETGSGVYNISGRKHLESNGFQSSAYRHFPIFFPFSNLSNVGNATTHPRGGHLSDLFEQIKTDPPKITITYSSSPSPSHVPLLSLVEHFTKINNLLFSVESNLTSSENVNRSPIQGVFKRSETQGEGKAQSIDGDMATLTQNLESQNVSSFGITFGVGSENDSVVENISSSDSQRMQSRRAFIPPVLVPLSHEISASQHIPNSQVPTISDSSLIVVNQNTNEDLWEELRDYNPQIDPGEPESWFNLLINRNLNSDEVLRRQPNFFSPIVVNQNTNEDLKEELRDYDPHIESESQVPTISGSSLIVVNQNTNEDLKEELRDYDPHIEPESQVPTISGSSLIVVNQNTNEDLKEELRDYDPHIEPESQVPTISGSSLIVVNQNTNDDLKEELRDYEDLLEELRDYNPQIEPGEPESWFNLLINRNLNSDEVLRRQPNFFSPIVVNQNTNEDLKEELRDYDPHIESESQVPTISGSSLIVVNQNTNEDLKEELRDYDPHIEPESQVPTISGSSLIVVNQNTNEDLKEELRDYDPHIEPESQVPTISGSSLIVVNQNTNDDLKEELRDYEDLLEELRDYNPQIEPGEPESWFNLLINRNLNSDEVLRRQPNFFSPIVVNQNTNEDLKEELRDYDPHIEPESQLPTISGSSLIVVNQNTNEDLLEELRDYNPQIEPGEPESRFNLLINRNLNSDEVLRRQPKFFSPGHKIITREAIGKGLGHFENDTEIAKSSLTVFKNNTLKRENTGMIFNDSNLSLSPTSGERADLNQTASREDRKGSLSRGASKILSPFYFTPHPDTKESGVSETFRAPLMPSSSGPHSFMPILFEISSMSTIPSFSSSTWQSSGSLPFTSSNISPLSSTLSPPSPSSVPSSSTPSPSHSSSLSSSLSSFTPSIPSSSSSHLHTSSPSLSTSLSPSSSPLPSLSSSLSSPSSSLSPSSPSLSSSSFSSPLPSDSSLGSSSSSAPSSSLHSPISSSSFSSFPSSSLHSSTSSFSHSPFSTTSSLHSPTSSSSPLPSSLDLPTSSSSSTLTSPSLSPSLLSPISSPPFIPSSFSSPSSPLPTSFSSSPSPNSSSSTSSSFSSHLTSSLSFLPSFISSPSSSSLPSTSLLESPLLDATSGPSNSSEEDAANEENVILETEGNVLAIEETPTATSENLLGLDDFGLGNKSLNIKIIPVQDYATPFHVDPSPSTGVTSVLELLADTKPLKLENDEVNRESIVNHVPCRPIGQCIRRYGDHHLDACVYDFLPVCQKDHVRCLDNYIGSINESCFEGTAKTVKNSEYELLLSTFEDDNLLKALRNNFPGVIDTIDGTNIIQKEKVLLGHFKSSEERVGKSSDHGTGDFRCAVISICQRRYGASPSDALTFGFQPDCPEGEVRCLDGSPLLKD